MEEDIQHVENMEYVENMGHVENMTYHQMENVKYPENSQQIIDEHNYTTMVPDYNESDSCGENSYIEDDYQGELIIDEDSQKMTESLKLSYINKKWIDDLKKQDLPIFKDWVEHYTTAHAYMQHKQLPGVKNCVQNFSEAENILSAFQNILAFLEKL